MPGCVHCSEGAEQFQVGLGVSDQQPAARDQRLVKVVDERPHDRRGEVNGDVAAQDHVEGEQVVHQRREVLGHQIVILERNALPIFRIDAPAVAFGRETGPLHVLGGVAQRPGIEETFAGPASGKWRLMSVAEVDPSCPARRVSRSRAEGSTTNTPPPRRANRQAPDTQLPTGSVPGEPLGQDHVAQGVKEFAMAEEERLADGQVFDERVEFGLSVRLVSQQLQVRGAVADAGRR